MSTKKHYATIELDDRETLNASHALARAVDAGILAGALIDNNSLPTAATAFRLLSDVALQALQPIGRAKATAATFREMAEIPGMKAITLTASDALLGLTVIWSYYSATPVDDGDEADKRRARAGTVREIAELLSALKGVHPSEAWPISLDRCHSAWTLVANHFAAIDDNPRAAAIADTWTREAGFLRFFN